MTAAEMLTDGAHHLSIDQLTVPGCSGLIGLTSCPGIKDSLAISGNLQRDLCSDLAAIAAWHGETLVSLLEELEFELLGVGDLRDEAALAGITWLHLPIVDGWVPDNRFEERRRVLGPVLHGQLQAGRRVVIHCRAGLGRTGLISNCYRGAV